MPIPWYTIKQAKTAAFQKQLRETGCYKSRYGERSVHLPSMVASPIFALMLSELIVTASVHARKPGFMNKEWSLFGMRVIVLVEKLGGYVEIDGFEKITRLGRPVVWVSNHVGSLETYMLPPILMSWPGLIIVLKEELASYPLFGAVVRGVDPIKVQRKSPVADLRKVLEDGKAGIDAGRSALIFPQGRRERLFNPASFNSLGTKLAQHAKAPVVPIAVATDFLRVGKKHRDLGMSVHPSSPVRISCGPIIPHDLHRDEIQSRCTGFISSKLAEWEKLDKRKMLADPEMTAAPETAETPALVK